MKKILTCLATTLLSILLIANIAQASLISGSTAFSVVGKWSGRIDWSVFAPIDGTSPLGPIADYGYYYQIFNDNTSVKSLSQLTIDNPYKVAITDVGFINATGDIAPISWNAGLDGAMYTFNFTNLITAGKSSDMLYLTSPYAPGSASAGLQALGFNDYHDVPFPVPEPTSMVLFGMGILGLLGLGRKKAA